MANYFLKICFLAFNQIPDVKDLEKQEKQSKLSIIDYDGDRVNLCKDKFIENKYYVQAGFIHKKYIYIFRPSGKKVKLVEELLIENESSDPAKIKIYRHAISDDYSKQPKKFSNPVNDFDILIQQNNTKYSNFFYLSNTRLFSKNEKTSEVKAARIEYFEDGLTKSYVDSNYDKSFTTRDHRFLCINFYKEICLKQNRQSYNKNIEFYYYKMQDKYGIDVPGLAAYIYLDDIYEIGKELINKYIHARDTYLLYTTGEYSYLTQLPTYIDAFTFETYIMPKCNNNNIVKNAYIIKTEKNHYELDTDIKENVAESVLNIFNDIKYNPYYIYKYSRLPKYWKNVPRLYIISQKVDLVLKSMKNYSRYTKHLKQYQNVKIEDEIYEDASSFLIKYKVKTKSFIEKCEKTASDAIEWFKSGRFFEIILDYEFINNHDVKYKFYDIYTDWLLKLTETDSGKYFIYNKFLEAKRRIESLEKDLKDKSKRKKFNNKKELKDFTIEEVPNLYKETQSTNFLMYFFIISRKFSIGLSNVLTSIVSATSKYIQINNIGETLSKLLVYNHIKLVFESEVNLYEYYANYSKKLLVSTSNIKVTAKKIIDIEILESSPFNKALKFPKKSYEILNTCFDLMNLIFAINDGYNALNKKDTEAIIINTIAVLGAAVDLFINFVKGSVNRWASFISASIDAVVCALQSRRAFVRNDLDSATAYAFAAACFTIVVICTAKAAIAGTAAGPVGTAIGAAAGLTAGVCISIAMYTADDPYEQWLENCCWGSSYKSTWGRNQELDGTQFNFGELRDDMDNQIIAFDCLIRGFEIKSDGYHDTKDLIKCDYGYLVIDIIPRVLYVGSQIKLYIKNVKGKIKNEWKPIIINHENCNCQYEISTTGAILIKKVSIRILDGDVKKLQKKHKVINDHFVDPKFTKTIFTNKLPDTPDLITMMKKSHDFIIKVEINLINDIIIQNLDEKNIYFSKSVIVKERIPPAYGWYGEVYDKDKIRVDYK